MHSLRNNLAFLRGNQSGSAMAGHETLSPRPVPENLCELRNIVLEIFHVVDQSQYVSRQVKDALKDSARYLEAECSEFVSLTHLAQRAAEDSANVLLLRIQFFEALKDRIRALSQLQARFVDSREAFRACPANLLLEGIREARGHTYSGMLSGLEPLFRKIEKHYHEINVALLKEEERLKEIYKSLRVTPDDKLRWENIRDACVEASTLLTSEVPPQHPHMPQQTQPPRNKAARHIRALAETILDARQNLLQSHQTITNLTNQPQFSLLRLESEYRRSERTCRQRIYDVRQFSEQFLGSVAEVPPLDEFRDHVVPSAAESSAKILRNVQEQVQKTKYAVLTVFPQLQGHFSSFEHDLPIVDASMQRMYATLRRLVRPLEQPDDPREGVLRSMKPTELMDEHMMYKDLSQKWANVQLQHSHRGPHPFS